MYYYTLAIEFKEKKKRKGKKKELRHVFILGCHIPNQKLGIFLILKERAYIKEYLAVCQKKLPGLIRRYLLIWMRVCF